MKGLVTIILICLLIFFASVIIVHKEVDTVLEEVNSMDLSANPDWWINSGGQLIMENGIWKTMQGEASSDNKWRGLYAKSNPLDTDNGLHPQNLFRFVTRDIWKNYRQQAYFNIQKDNLSSSTNRNDSNGLLLMMRYKDSDNLYYAGLRVDGTAVIKKKVNGEYLTLTNPVYIKDQKYDVLDNPNLLPKNVWLGIRADIRDLSDGSTQIQLYVDEGKQGIWTPIAEAIDDGQSYGGETISIKSYAGIRTDFMDVLISDYRVEEFL